jgi:hypothetical protein
MRLDYCGTKIIQIQIQSFLITRYKVVTKKYSFREKYMIISLDVSFKIYKVSMLSDPKSPKVSKTPPPSPADFITREQAASIQGRNLQFSHRHLA